MWPKAWNITWFKQNHRETHAATSLPSCPTNSSLRPADALRWWRKPPHKNRAEPSHQTTPSDVVQKENQQKFRLFLIGDTTSEPWIYRCSPCHENKVEYWPLGTELSLSITEALTNGWQHMRLRCSGFAINAYRPTTSTAKTFTEYVHDKSLIIDITMISLKAKHQKK